MTTPEAEQEIFDYVAMHCPYAENVCEYLRGVIDSGCTLELDRPNIEVKHGDRLVARVDVPDGSVAINTGGA
jgi:hypothetical protein